jgi:DTW domain-containing protein YfiP
MHHRETYLTSNTANLAKLTLPKCEILLRGLKDKPFHIDLLKLNDSEMPIYLFPHDNAVELNQEFLDQYPQKKFHLIVPDGSWTQAIKCYRRENGLHNITCVKLPIGGPGRYKLRKTSDENKLSTFEAISRSLSILENSSSIQDELNHIFDTMVERVIRGRTAFEN